MLHCFRALGVNIALDVLSGAVHVLDDMAFEALTDLEAGRDPRPALLAKYAEKDVDELLNEFFKKEYYVNVKSDTKQKNSA